MDRFCTPRAPSAICCALAALLTNASAVFARRCVAGLEADAAHCESNVERSLALCTALAPEIGYDKAAEIAKHAHKKGLTLKEAGLELGLVDEETFDRVVKPETMLGR